MTDHSNSARRGVGYWAVVVLAIVLVLFGLPIFGGGVYLAWLGGSWYYVFAGLGLLATAWFLVRASMLAVWIYLLTFIFTVVWAFWEKGFDWWAQVPRLVAPTVILVLVLATIPVLRRASSSQARPRDADQGKSHQVTESRRQTESRRPKKPHSTKTLLPTAS
ncbi:hypothetical protein [Jiella marina]|uniref:hypothetical protein n=1 Tax=Jiella sp. LLJ827 TaxID=2917712 RepID=UPI0021013E65|nr:hypothetical protein [Jiella sp. LLJ827]MCQ0988780.1 hypothetical protein [Jiella sp. LLJ827]